MAADISNVFAGAAYVANGATVAADSIAIPVAAIHSWGTMDPATGDVDLIFGLVDKCASYLAGQTYTNVAATEADRIVDATTLRKDYTFRVNLAWDSDTATSSMNVKSEPV